MDPLFKLKEAPGVGLLAGGARPIKKEDKCLTPHLFFYLNFNVFLLKFYNC
jgi:hypothetical protein